MTWRAMSASPSGEAAADAHPSPLAALVKLLAGSVAAVMSTVAFDEFLDRDGQRVRDLTNCETPEGVRMYVAEPPSPSPPPPPGIEPATSNPGAGTGAPAVIVVHQFFGLRQREIDLCDELAARGYVAIAPDTFEGKSTQWIPRAITLVADTILAAEWGAAPLMSALRWGLSDIARHS